MYSYNNNGLIVRWDGSSFVSPGATFASRSPADGTSDIGKQNDPRMAIYSDNGYPNIYVSAADWSVNTYSSGKGITVRQFE
jgi:hypothetical protein